jgi:Holliday junction resolvase RusA-like endonuclease
VNELYGHAPGGRVFKTPKARAYSTLVAFYGRAARQEAGLSTWLGPVRVGLRFFFGSARPDEDGPVKLVLDALQAPNPKLKRVGAGIVRNDSQVTGHSVARGEVDRLNPRTEVEITAEDEEGARMREEKGLTKCVSPRRRAKLHGRKLQPSVRDYR